MPETKKLVVILGAHRSGTSLCTAAVESLGAYLGRQLDYANDENPKGFFEHPDIVDFNDRLLSFLGGSWDNPLFDGAAELHGIDTRIWQEEAVDLFGKAFGDSPFVAVKDPRFCQLLSFWVPVFHEAGYDQEAIFFVHSIRDVAEVALSQRDRSRKNPSFYDLGEHLEEGAALWLALTAQAIESTRDSNTLYVSYHDVLDAPARVLTELALFLDVQPDEERAAAFCTEFVDKSLYHSEKVESVSAQLAESFPQVLRFHSKLQNVLSNEGNLGRSIDDSLAFYDHVDTQVALRRVIAPAFSRLSVNGRDARLRVERVEDELENLSGQKMELVETAQNQKAELVENAKNIAREHERVLLPLREELEQMQLATESQTEQLDRQGRVNSALSTQLKATRIDFDKRFSQQDARLVSALDDIEKLTAENVHLKKITGSDTGPQGSILGTFAALVRGLRRPLRSVRTRLSRARERVKREWMRFRLKAIEKYHWLSQSRPGTAWILRRGLRPFFHGMDRLLGDTAHLQPLFRDETGSQLLKFQQPLEEQNFAPLISVIVPNYNHAAYLGVRLESIFSQTYENYEVILLDDASDDDSVKILKDFHERYKERSILVMNEKNSGGVFHQWQRGLDLARGDIIWIAESDDWCSDNFLETLVPYFANEAVQLAYARSVFMDQGGENQIWSIEEYLHDVDPLRWNTSFVETGATIVAECFGEKNIVPNVSSALFRSPRNLEILHDPQWLQMRTCGDWMLYLHLLRGGMVAYSPLTTNFYRMHDGNTSVASYSEDEFYKEHERVAITVHQFFDVPWKVFERLRDHLGAHWRNTRNDYNPELFDACFSLERVRQMKVQRAPNLLMASYAFCAGGGETFPVSLANIMKGQGYNITYMDCAQEPRNGGIRARLRLDIPVVSDFRQLERIVEEFNIDIIHSHHAWMEGTILNLLPEDNPVKKVVTLHGMYETMNEYDLKEILPRLARRISCFVYVAEKNLTALRKHKLADRVQVARIDNALQAEKFDEIRREDLGIPQGAFVLTLLSRGMVEKGWVEAIAAVTRARASVQRDIHLLLVGDGPEYERLSGETLPEFVHLEGFQQNVRGYFAVADIGFLPSKFRGESFPLVIIECLQAGRPFLASDLGEIRNMLASSAGNAGTVVGLKGGEVDVPAVAAEIARLASDAQYYEGLTVGAREAVKKFDPGILARKHDEVYRRVIAEQKMTA